MKSSSLRRSIALAALALAACSGEPPVTETAPPGQGAPEMDAAAAVPEVARDPAAVVCTVNGEAITGAEVDEQFGRLLGGNVAMIPPDQLGSLRAQYESQLVDDLVVDRLLRQAAKQVEVAETEIEEMLDETLANAEASLPEGTSVDDALADANLTVEDLRTSIGDRLRVQKLLDEKVESVPQPAEDAIEAFYAENAEQFSQPESVEARHVLVAFEEGDSDEVKAEKKQRALDVRAKLAAEGADFAALAAEHSDCPSKAQGGSLGRFGRGQMVPEFETVAFELPAHELSDVVETQFGYHLIEVTEHHAGGVEPLEDVREQIANELMDGERRTIIEGYVASLKAQAKIEYPEQG